jgi:hypothetical protein
LEQPHLNPFCGVTHWGPWALSSVDSSSADAGVSGVCPTRAGLRGPPSPPPRAAAPLSLSPPLARCGSLTYSAVAAMLQAELQAALRGLSLCDSERGRNLLTVCVAASVELLHRCGDTVTSRMLQQGALQGPFQQLLTGLVLPALAATAPAALRMQRRVAQVSPPPRPIEC